VNIVNPYYTAKDGNIFTIRAKEFESLLEKVRHILLPVEDLEFQVTDLELKEARTARGEMHKTVKNTLAIKLQKGNVEVDLSMAIPKLIDNNYIIINGRRKIPLFQLFDIPIVTRGKNIKFRSNVATIQISQNIKEAPYIFINFLGRKIPMFLVMFAYFGAEELNSRFDLTTLEINYDDGIIEGIDDPTSMYSKLLFDLKACFDSGDIIREDIIKEIGLIFTTFSPRQKGEDLIFALDLILRVDPYTEALLIRDNVLDELLDVMKSSEGYDDTNFMNKRIRCLEYIIVSKVSKAVFDFCMANRSARSPKFNINSSQILSECNVSDIVQFDFAINPIDEVTKLSRTSLVGPGGFKRENVPEHLRDITESMFGRMCSVDTLDRDNCGVLQNMLVNTQVDDNLRFTSDVLEKQPVSAPVSMVPFLEHDDQTRLQMASSQMRQAIMLKDFDVPLIQSGCEGLYTKFGHFTCVAKDDGVVVYNDDRWIVVRYANEEIDVFEVSYRKIYVQNMDFMKIYVKTGDQFKKNDILAESNFCTDGKINIGRNLLTAIMIYYGYNYEDGIVISDRLVKDDLLTSVHYIDLSFTLPPNKVLMSLDDNKYKPLPDINETVKAMVPYAKLKEVPVGPTNFCDIFTETRDLRAKRNILITDVNIYPNIWNDGVPEWKTWVKEKIEAQKKVQADFQEILFGNFPSDIAKQFVKDHNLDSHDQVGKYKNKAEKVNGILIEMFGIYTRKIRVGDKIGNRHGNKGVISSIVPHETMPQLEDGRHVDICINPLGIIGRMNIGQLFELHIAMALDNLKLAMSKMLEEGKNQQEIKDFYLGFIKIIDNTEIGWYYHQIEEQLPEVIDAEFVDKMTVIQPPFESVDEKLTEKALAYTMTQFEYKIFDPLSGKYILNKIAVGYMYFIRMVHIAESRLAARGVGTYAKKTLQPLAGRKNKGGQRCGEMETACLIGHDAPINLHEMFTTKSDCIDLKNQYIRSVIETDLLQSDEVVIDEESESVKLLQACLTVVGVDLGLKPVAQPREEIIDNDERSSGHSED